MVGEEEIVHEATCDLCPPGTWIRGIRMKCVVCPDYDLCTSCFTSKRFSRCDSSHVFYALDVQVPNVNFGPLGNRTGAVHSGFKCGICRSGKDIVGIRYQCVQCQLDICESCEFSGAHEPTHVRMKVSQPTVVNSNSHESNKIQTSIFTHQQPMVRMLRPENGRGGMNPFTPDAPAARMLRPENGRGGAFMLRPQNGRGGMNPFTPDAPAARMLRPENGRGGAFMLRPENGRGGDPSGETLFGMARCINGRNDFAPLAFNFGNGGANSGDDNNK